MLFFTEVTKIIVKIGSPVLRYVHSPLQLRCDKLQSSYFRLCADYCIAVLQGSKHEVQCVALSCGISN